MSAPNSMMLNKAPGDLVAIHAIDTIPANNGFTQCQIMTAQNRKQSETGDLARLLTLKLESRVMLTVNIDIQDRLINGQMGVVKIFEIADNAVSTIFIKFDDREAGRKSVGENRFARQIIGFQLRMTHIFLLETLAIHYQNKEHSFL